MGSLGLNPRATLDHSSQSGAYDLSATATIYKPISFSSLNYTSSLKMAKLPRPIPRTIPLAPSHYGQTLGFYKY